MGNRQSLQLVVLGQPALGDPIQVAFEAIHIDRRPLAIWRDEPVKRPRRTWLARIAQMPFYAYFRRSYP